MTNRAANEAGNETYISPPVQRAAKLLRHIAEGDPVINMAHTARALGINRTTLVRLLHTLQAERFIEPVGTASGGWRIGIGLIGLAAQSFFSEDLIKVSVPVLTKLTEQVSLSGSLGRVGRSGDRLPRSPHAEPFFRKQYSCGQPSSGARRQHGSDYSRVSAECQS